MSYVKDGMGILRWPKNETELKRRIKDIFLQCALPPRHLCSLCLVHLG